MRRGNHEVTASINNTDGVNNTDAVNIEDLDNTGKMLSSEDMDDYDPHKHRNRPTPTS